MLVHLDHELELRHELEDLEQGCKRFSPVEALADGVVAAYRVHAGRDGRAYVCESVDGAASRRQR